MHARIDHVVLWVTDPLRSLEFFERIVGLAPERADDFRAGKVPFPSVRVSSDSVIDLMGRDFGTAIDSMLGMPGSAGQPVNHVCIAMTRSDFEALRTRLTDNGVTVLSPMTNSFGARGVAPQAFYFLDPDNNVIEARYYD